MSTENAAAAVQVYSHGAQILIFCHWYTWARHRVRVPGIQTHRMRECKLNLNDDCTHWTLEGRQAAGKFIRRLSDTLSPLALCSEIYDKCSEWRENSLNVFHWHLPLRPSPNDTSRSADVQWCTTACAPQNCITLVCYFWCGAWCLLASHKHDCNLNHSANTRYIHRNWYHLAQLIASSAALFHY